MTHPPTTDITSVAAAWKGAFFPILLAHRIARVTIAYDGAGDEGQINDVAAYRGDGEGAWVEFEVLVKSGAVNLTHNARFVDSTTDETEL